jgi:tetratricopeptide (TPR) repeat protein
MDPDTVNPMDPEELVRQGIKAFKAGEQVQAHDLFTRAIQTDPNYQLALLWLASVEDDPAQQRQHLQRAMAINPDNGAGQRAAADLARLDSGAEAVPLPPPPDAGHQPPVTVVPPAKRSMSPILWVVLAVIGSLVILLPLMCIVVIGILSLLGGQVSEVFENVNSGLR